LSCFGAFSCGGRPAGEVADGGHAQADGGIAPGGELVELGEFAVRRGDADFKSFGFTVPALAFGFGDAGEQVVADAGQPLPLGWVNP